MSGQVEEKDRGSPPGDLGGLLARALRRVELSSGSEIQGMVHFRDRLDAVCLNRPGFPGGSTP